MIELNKIYNEDCLEGMKMIPDGFVDLTVTSPPYDNLRTYNGNIEQWSFEKFQGIAKELYRVTANGGVVIWIVADATIKGSETGTSFRQALYFKECGFNIHDTMIWDKGGFTATGTLRARYGSVFEYMFIFSKGKPKTFNPIKDRKNKNTSGSFHKVIRQKDGTTKSTGYTKRNEYGQRFNIWRMPGVTPKERTGHPAQFPIALAQDHIISWSNEGDTVLDCFMGSGTTGKMALLNNRNYIGFELDKHYCDIANERIRKALADSTRKDYDNENTCSLRGIAGGND